MLMILVVLQDIYRKMNESSFFLYLALGKHSGSCHRQDGHSTQECFFKNFRGLQASVPCYLKGFHTFSMLQSHE